MKKVLNFFSKKKNVLVLVHFCGGVFSFLSLYMIIIYDDDDDDDNDNGFKTKKKKK